MRFHGTPLQIELEGDRLTVFVQADGSPVEVRVGDVVEEIQAGERHAFDFRGP
jgi:hypothetical protein